MTGRPSVLLSAVCVMVGVAMVWPHVQGAAPAQGAQRGAGGRGGGRADAPIVGPGNLVTGVWGADPTAVDSRDWGWMSKSYVGANYKRPFYNKAKELLFSGKQVTSSTIHPLDPDI